MQPMSTRELAQLAYLIGHGATEIEKSPTAKDKYWIGCSCGYRTSVRRTPSLCIQAITHHLYQAVKSYAATGLPLPEEGEMSPPLTETGQVNIGESLPRVTATG